MAGNPMFIKKYDNPQELLEKIEEYFNTTPPKEQTRAGLCVFLGITTMTLCNYKNGSQGDEIAEVVRWAYTRMEHKYEMDLNYRPNPTGPIFALKQYGWKDSQDVDVKASGFESVCNDPRPSEK